jgi:hypothetical protein
MKAEGRSKRVDRIDRAIEKLSSDKADVKYGSLKRLRQISEDTPAALYPRIDHIVGLLDCDNSFIKWGAMLIVANLAGVDRLGKIDRILNRYLKPITGHVMISAANVIGGSGKIALAKPRLADRIAGRVLKVEQARYQTDECRNVAIGHAIDSLDLMFDHLKRKKGPVRAFVARQLTNRRDAVRKRASLFLRRRGPCN